MKRKITNVKPPNACIEEKYYLKGKINKLKINVVKIKRDNLKEKCFLYKIACVMAATMIA